MLNFKNSHKIFLINMQVTIIIKRQFILKLLTINKINCQIKRIYLASLNTKNNYLSFEASPARILFVDIYFLNYSKTLA